MGNPKPFPAAQAMGTSPNPNAALRVGNASSVPHSSNKVALQTAIAVDNNKKERKVCALLDCGSQKSFITAKAVKDFGLVPARMESLGIKVFGKNEVDFAMRDVLVITLSVTESESAQIDCLLVQEIQI